MLNLNHQYLNGQTVVLDLSWYAPYKQYGDSVICLFVYVLFIWHVFKNASSIINGITPNSSTMHNMVDTINKHS